MGLYVVITEKASQVVVCKSPAGSLGLIISFAKMSEFSDKPFFEIFTFFVVLKYCTCS